MSRSSSPQHIHTRKHDYMITPIYVENSFFTPILPYALAFAAGAMIFVVVEEVIPETQQDRFTDIATLGFIGGFVVMMTLDVALGG